MILKLLLFVFALAGLLLTASLYLYTRGKQPNSINDINPEKKMTFLNQERNKVSAAWAAPPVAGIG